MKKRGIQFYREYLFGRKYNKYRRLARQYHTSTWVIYRLIHGTSIRDEYELNIYHQLVEENPSYFQ
jgi:Mor family transcriptional regulator